jgi:type III pantothenate kinase
MEFVIDAGNSNIVFALHQNGNWLWLDRVDTKANINEVFLQAYYTDLLIEHDIPAEAVQQISISCVVSEISEVLKDSIWRYFGQHPIFLSPEIFKNLPFNIPKPYEIGADLVANAFAVHLLHPGNHIIVDFGTALTFTIYTEGKGIEGVTIAPGVKTAIQALSIQTSKLPVVSVEFPESVIGQNTSHAIQAGVMYGYVGLVKELLKKIQEEKETIYSCIATGGLSEFMNPLHDAFTEVDPYLTLEGIRLIGQYHKTKK